MHREEESELSGDEEEVDDDDKDKVDELDIEGNLHAYMCSFSSSKAKSQLCIAFICIVFLM